MDGKLLFTSSKKWGREINDITTWLEAFTIFSWIFCRAHSFRWQIVTQYKLLIIKTSRQFPRKAWLHYDIAFRRDAGACDLRDWSCTNLDFYNFHTRTSSFQSGSSSNGSHSLFIPLPCCPISVHEMMVPANGPLVCAATVTVARSVKATTCTSTVLYRHPGHISNTPTQLPQLGISTRGVNMVANPRSGTCQKDLENSVNMLCYVKFEDSLITISGNASLVFLIYLPCASSRLHIL